MQNRDVTGVWINKRTPTVSVVVIRVFSEKGLILPIYTDYVELDNGVKIRYSTLTRNYEKRQNGFIELVEEE